MTQKSMKMLLILSAILALAISVNALNWPVWPDSTYHPVSASYGYWHGEGSDIHFGIDIAVPFLTPVYAIQSGYVKAVMTLYPDFDGAESRWRIVVGDSLGSQATDGWMYAHIASFSISVRVGDWVDAGDSIGAVVNWPYGSTVAEHLHLSKINYYGDSAHWANNFVNWKYIANPLEEIDNINDTVHPVLENAYGNQLFAFCANETNNYFGEGTTLNGNVDIVCLAYDYYNWFGWKNIPYSIEYSISGDTITPWINSVCFTGPLDIFANEGIITGTVYRDDAICNTFWTLEDQDHYFMLTNTNGDSIIENSDRQYSWQTANFHNGDYAVRVKVCDRSGNYTLDSMTVSVANYFALSGHIGLSDANPYLAGTSITAIPDGITVTTNATGEYSIPLIGGGPQAITFARAGYETIDTLVVMNQSRQIDLVLEIGPFLCGDANSDGKVNLSDVSFIINTLYHGGPKPNTREQADVNNDGKLNLLDVSYIINYRYRHGPEPVCL